jgi:hypothetical protein
MGDCNIPSFDWTGGLSLLNYHYYSKVKGDVFISTCAFDFSRGIVSVGSSITLGSVFYNFSYLFITFDYSVALKPDTYHSSLAIDFIALCNYFPHLHVFVQHICVKGLYSIVHV